MTATFTPNKGFTRPANGDNVNTWDVPVNLDWTQIDTAFGGSTLLNSTGLSGDQTLAVASYLPLSLLISGAPTATITYVIPATVGGQWVFNNGTTGGKTVGIKSAAGGATITVPAGFSSLVSCDGSSTGMRISHNSVADFSATGAVTIGSTLSVGGALTLNDPAITLPGSALNIGANTLVLNSGVKTVGINRATVPNPPIFLSVAGRIESQTGGFVFPDSSLQATAAFNGQRLISDQTVSGTGNIDVTGISSSINNLSVYFDLSSFTATPTATLFIQFFVSGVIDGNADYDWTRSINTVGTPSADSATAATFMTIATTVPNVGPISGFATLSGIQETISTMVNYKASYFNPSLPGGIIGIDGFGSRAASGPIDGIRFQLSAGNMSGRLTVLGD